MPFSSNDLIWSLVVPLLAATGLRFVLSWVVSRFEAAPSIETSEEPSTSTIAPSALPLETAIPLIAAAAIGYFQLELGPLVPKAHYEWLPLGVLIAAVVATLVGFFQRYAVVRFGLLPLAYAGVVGGVGYMLMPTWDDLSPSYPVYLTCWCAGVWLLACTTEWAPDRGRWSFAIVWLGTCLAVAIVVALSESLRFAQIAGLTFSGSLGLVIGGMLMRRGLLGGLGLTLTTYLGGILLIAHVNSFSDVPLVSYWLPMMGPLLSVAFATLLPGKISGFARGTCVVLVAAIPSLVAITLAVLATMPE
ncbi:hypothetical protein AB1L30_18660 [Bremerella sp. JC817]|uniref:hypothetical protein n=1 Tax=Bremerella sp. JC817 TaxID=3231756 RepID=UPI00345AE5E6